MTNGTQTAGMFRQQGCAKTTSGDFAGALRTLASLPSKDAGRFTFHVARIHAENGGATEVLAWAGSRPSPTLRVDALLAAASGVLKRIESGKSR